MFLRFVAVGAIFIVSACAETYRFSPNGQEFRGSEAQTAYREMLTLQGTAAKTDRPVRLLYAPMPTYPADMLKTRVTGHTVMRFTVEPDGGVSEIQVVSASNRSFAGAAASALLQWKFEPIEKSGKTVSMVFQIPIDFEL